MEEQTKTAVDRQSGGMPANAQHTKTAYQGETKFCKHCGKMIPKDAVICTACGRQVEEIQHNNASAPQIVINNDNNNLNTNTVNAAVNAKLKNKWVSFVLCLFLGFLGAHKFYEGKAGMGILYLLTVGLFGIGVIIDLIVILTKPKEYIP